MIGIVTLNDVLEYEAELDDLAVFSVNLNDKLVYKEVSEELP